MQAARRLLSALPQKLRMGQQPIGLGPQPIGRIVPFEISGPVLLAPVIQFGHEISLLADSIASLWDIFECPPERCGSVA